MPRHVCTFASELNSYLCFPLSTLFIADAESLIRTVPGEDHTNGFFVAVFVRGEPTSSGNSLKRELDDGEIGEPVSRKKPKKKRKKKTKSLAASIAVDEELDLDAQ